MSESSARRRYRAPAGDRAWLLALSEDASPAEIPDEGAQPARISQALQSACESTERSRESWQKQSINGFERPLAELRREARKELLGLALDATSAIRAVQLSSTGPDSDAPLILTGHQPSLAHPGVWSKNIAADRIASLLGGRSINLVVDTDTLNDRGLRVPERDGIEAQLTRLDYDAASPAAPYIETRITDVDAFDSFGTRVTNHMRSQWGITPLIESNWPDASPITPYEPLSYRFTRMRHCQELRWKLDNLEVFLSHLTDTTAFMQFFLDVVRRADQFLEIHNRAVVDYRRDHHLRSQSHPVPLLIRDGDKIELPFWYWEASEIQRHPLFAIRREDAIELWSADRSSHDPIAEVPLSASDSGSDVMFDWFRSQRLRIAPRALTTTLFCRVWLADLFIHGIGGATYDQMTDRLIQEFYGITPPPFLVLTGTLRLPIRDVPDVSNDEICRQQRLLRELEHQPERHVKDASPDLFAEKSQLIDAERYRSTLVLSRSERRGLRSVNRDRWLKLREINRQLASRLSSRMEMEKQRLGTLRAAMQSKQILQSREFSAWLYPEVLLRDFFGALRD